MRFEGIGQTGSTSLAVVAPGIAEALVATAAGLFAAIPAVYFYNHLTQKLKELASTMDDFSLEFSQYLRTELLLDFERHSDAKSPDFGWQWIRLPPPASWSAHRDVAV